ncbi:ubiquitin-specific protease doa4 [Saccharomyces pastorianus]|uniref:Ubiquitin carboxyl-terminal hydrolase n=1 Tax=Saccharomyces pastorianus TaxID=27292 RepID=A0A6C1E2C1_SACPS|nr:ubiquitin-specific protease doa4 [Saccharomyces pastorianus]
MEQNIISTINDENIQNRSKYLTIAQLTAIAETKINEFIINGKTKDRDLSSLLDKCIDILSIYKKNSKDIKVIISCRNKGAMTNSNYDIKIQLNYIYYKIIHIIVTAKIPHLNEFAKIKSHKSSKNDGDSNSSNNEFQLMNIYNTLLETLLKDENITKIKNFIKSSIQQMKLHHEQEECHLMQTGSHITPDQLNSLIVLSTSSSSSQMETLLIDIRSRLEFKKSHIDFKNIICLEPVSFKMSYSDRDLEKKSLITSPNDEIKLFQSRNLFKFIILYTDSNDYNVRQQAVLLDILLNRSFEKPISNDFTKIFILQSGFPGWLSSNHVNQTSSSCPQSNNIKDDSVYVNGNTSGLSLQHLPKMSPSISHSMDDSMKEMLISPIPINHLQQQQQQQSDNSYKLQRSSSFKKLFSNYTSTSPKNMNSNLYSISSLSISNSPSPLPLSSPNSMKNDSLPFNYPETPHLWKNNEADSMTNQREQLNHNSFTHITPINTRAITTPSRTTTPKLQRFPQAISMNLNLNSNSNNSSTSTIQPACLTLSNSSSLDHIDVSQTSPSHNYDLDFAVGLENLGNSCYMNCIIQCILGTHELTQIFLDDSYAKHININSKLGSKGILAKYFARLVHLMYKKQVDSSKKDSISPIKFKLACGSVNSLFKTASQQDCQEFCQFLLDGLHEDLNQCGSNPPLKELSQEAETRRERLSLRIASSIEWERFLTTDFSVIVDLFQGQYASRLKCKTCNHTSTTYQPFTVLSIPIPRKNSQNKITIEDCFKEFTKCENLEIDEQWLCPHCKSRQPSTKQLTITRLPRNLIIHLKRFDNFLNKNNDFVKYPFLLDLTPFWANDFDGVFPPGVNDDELPIRGQIPPFKYELYGVACHFGTLYGGHYTSYVKKGLSRGWLYFDDTKYRPAKNKTDAINSNAYVLFYHRVYGV